MKCDIVICIWNQKDITKDCIESICKNTRFPYRLVLIDNASDEPTQTYLESLKKDSRLEVMVIRNEENLGNTKAVNQGLVATDAEYVCNLDNDTYVTEGWLTEMVAATETDPRVGIVAPEGRGGLPPSSDAFADIEQCGQEASKRRGEYLEMATVDCYCALFTRTMIKEIGLWDEIFSPGYFDDTEYCRRAADAGFKLLGAKGAYVYHREGGSFKKNKMRDELFNRNKKIYHRMYGQPKRIVIVINQNDPAQYSKIKEEVVRLASRANWVWIIRKKSLPPLDLTPHSHIRPFIYPNLFFMLKAIIRILSRQKKKFDEIHVLTKPTKRIFKMFNSIHKAEVKHYQEVQ